jgi:tetratricopeptide (TPR) repeat protein
VREHFGERVRSGLPGAWKEGHRRLYEYFKQISKEQPTNSQEMAVVYVSIIHACEAGHHREGLALYRDRVTQGSRFFNTYELGAFSTEMALLYRFFESPWAQPVKSLTDLEKALIFRQTAYCQRVIGILPEAAKWLEKAVAIYKKLEEWKECLEVYGLLSYIYLNLGIFENSLKTANESVRISDQFEDSYYRWVNRVKAADILHNANRLTAARATFEEAETILQATHPDWWLYGVSGFKYCDFLITT